MASVHKAKQRKTTRKRTTTKNLRGEWTRAHIAQKAMASRPVLEELSEEVLEEKEIIPSGYSDLQEERKSSGSDKTPISFSVFLKDDWLFREKKIVMNCRVLNTCRSKVSDNIDIKDAKEKWKYTVSTFYVKWHAVIWK